MMLNLAQAGYGSLSGDGKRIQLPWIYRLSLRKGGDPSTPLQNYLKPRQSERLSQ
ncbi:MAG: hypothetical protein NW237_00535 [Cyanobacteriota bacterium]|nr:hypothetical protein [Cyanobacteriota bacterium]